tara:strand:+ start:625 stop:849 length:225 start_codon:yes stop_codon:yes gene_type:complete
MEIVNKKAKRCKVCQLETVKAGDFCGNQHRIFYLEFRLGFENLKCLEAEKPREYTAAQRKAFNVISDLLKAGKI